MDRKTKCLHFFLSNKNMLSNFSISLRKETADGLRIYFDFILRDYLLYKNEREQASVLLSPENLRNYTYIGSEKLYVKLYNLLLHQLHNAHSIDLIQFQFSRCSSFFQTRSWDRLWNTFNTVERIFVWKATLAISQEYRRK